MSSMEYHYGKLRKVDLLGKTKEEFFKDRCEEENIKLGTYYDTFEEAWRSETNNYDKYFIKHDEIYEPFEHEQSTDDSDIGKLIPHEDGTFTFIMSFYNGGTCLSECLQEALESYTEK